GQRAVVGVDADAAGGVLGGGADGALQRDAHVEDGPLHAVVQAGGAAGDDAGLVGQGGAGPLDGDGLAAQTVLPVGQAAGHHAVGDQDDPVVPKGVEGEPDHGRVDVDAVGDQLDL